MSEFRKPQLAFDPHFEIGFKGNLAYWGAGKNWVLHFNTPSLNCQILVKILTSYRFFLELKYKIPVEIISIP